MKKNENHVLRQRHTLSQNLLIDPFELQSTAVMAIQTAGQKTAKVAKIKIENQATIDLPAYTEQHINKALDFLPSEHLRGIEKLKLVDFINDPRSEEHTSE